MGEDAPETPAQIVRRARGKLSLDRFAEELGTSRQRVIAWEKGRSLPSEQYAVQIAERAGVDPSAFARSPDSLQDQFTSVYELLDEIRKLAADRGYLADPDLDELHPALEARLRSIEGAIEAAGASVKTSLEALDRGISRLERRLAAAAPPRTATKKRDAS